MSTGVVVARRSRLRTGFVSNAAHIQNDSVLGIGHAMSVDEDQDDSKGDVHEKNIDGYAFTCQRKT